MVLKLPSVSHNCIVLNFIVFLCPPHMKPLSPNTPSFTINVILQCFKHSNHIIWVLWPINNWHGQHQQQFMNIHLVEIYHSKPGNRQKLLVYTLQYLSTLGSCGGQQRLEQLSRFSIEAMIGEWCILYLAASIPNVLFLIFLARHNR